MSIIESAIHKAQLRGSVKTDSAHTQRRRWDTATSPTQDPEIVDRSGLANRLVKVASVDAATMAKNHILVRVSDQGALRAYKILRTRVLHRLEANGWNSFIVTGSEQGEGKTLTAINLAIALSQDPHTSAVLIDLDLQRPQVASYLGLSFDRGLGEYLLGEAGMDDIIYNLGNSAGVERLSVIPNSHTFQDSSELLTSVRMLELLRHLQATAPKRVLVFDMPPMMLADDVLTFAPQADGVLLVISEGHTNRSSVEKATELLGEMNVIGVVLNRSSERNDAAYY